MNKEALKTLLFFCNREKFDEALAINQKEQYYPLLNSNAEKLWERSTYIKALSHPSIFNSIVMDRDIYGMSLEEEDDFIILYQFTKLIKLIFPEHNEWAEIKKLMTQCLNIKHIYVFMM